MQVTGTIEREHWLSFEKAAFDDFWVELLFYLITWITSFWPTAYLVGQKKPEWLRKSLLRDLLCLINLPNFDEFPASVSIAKGELEPRRRWERRNFEFSWWSWLSFLLQCRPSRGWGGCNSSAAASPYCAGFRNFESWLPSLPTLEPCTLPLLPPRAFQKVLSPSPFSLQLFSQNGV